MVWLAAWRRFLGKKSMRYWLLPAGFYFIFFCFYTWPWISHFNHFFFADRGDGPQNVWNMWWINFSVTHLHQLPWYTSYLHYPYGTTLLGQTLNPFNGFVGIVLQGVFRMSLAQAFNTMITFSFVATGLTAFWLCYCFTKRYLPALIGGFIFTFSSYHLAHAIGHMQLTSLEWVPLFILLWWQLLTTPRFRYAAGAAVVLSLVVLCDYYYLLYCLVAAGLILGYLYLSKQLAPWTSRQTLPRLAVFAVLAALLVVPLPLALLRAGRADPFGGSHNELIFSTDLLTPFLDGGWWRFAGLTHWYWRHLRAYVSETSVYFGISVLTVLGVAIWKRQKLHRDIVFWLVLGALFAILSLGPQLMVFGHTFHAIILPYAVLEKLLPVLKLSGVPDRFIMMSFLAAAVVVAMTLAKLNLKIRRNQWLLALFCVVLFIELWPQTMPLTSAAQPAYVAALRRLGPGAVADYATPRPSTRLFHQTGYQRPMVLGYISRTPHSVDIQDHRVAHVLSSQQYELLCTQFHVRYLTLPPALPAPNLRVVYHDSSAVIYDLGAGRPC